MYYDYLKREIDNMAIFEQVVRLQKTGVIFKSTCPFHKEKTPSFIVYPPGHRSHNDIQEFASFYCFGCGVGGDIIKFHQLYKNLSSYQEAAKDLATIYNLKKDDESEIQKEYIKNIKENQQEKLLSLDVINLTCSKMLRQNNMPEQYFKWLDDRLNECNTEEAQIIPLEVKDIIKNFYKK